MSCYQFDIHEQILIIFGRTVTQQISNQKMPHFLPHLINASTYPAKQET